MAVHSPLNRWEVQVRRVLGIPDASRLHAKRVGGSHTRAFTRASRSLWESWKQSHTHKACTSLVITAKRALLYCLKIKSKLPIFKSRLSLMLPHIPHTDHHRIDYRWCKDGITPVLHRHTDITRGTISAVEQSREEPASTCTAVVFERADVTLHTLHSLHTLSLYPLSTGESLLSRHWRRACIM